MSIDIILFCYNQEQYIKKAVESILSQEFPLDCISRIIVADDHSTDNTLGIICDLYKRWQLTHNSIEWLFLPEEHNLGIAKNYKRSFKATTADYVFILEGDDYWLPGHVRQHIDAYKRNSHCSMVMSKISIIHTINGSDSQLEKNDWKYKTDEIEVDVHKQISEGNQLGNLSACSFRGTYLRQFPDELFELPVADWMFGIEIAQNGPILLLKDSTSVYRISDKGLWAGNSAWKNWKSMWAASRTYNNFHHKKFDADWIAFRKYLKRDLRCNWLHFMPRWVSILKKHLVKA